MKKVNNAKQKLKDLSMKPSERFQDFFTEFTRLVQESKMSETDKKEELYRRLTWRLQEKLIETVNDEEVSYEKFVKTATKTSNRFEQIDFDKPKSFQKFKNSKGKASFSTNTSGTQNQNQSTPTSTRENTPAVSEASKAGSNRDQERKQGLYYYCKEPGHIAFNCPKKKSSRVSSIQTTLPAKEESQATSSGNA